MSYRLFADLNLSELTASASKLRASDDPFVTKVPITVIDLIFARLIYL